LRAWAGAWPDVLQMEVSCGLFSFFVCELVGGEHLG
jgi:hypothetical protein